MIPRDFEGDFSLYFSLFDWNQMLKSKRTTTLNGTFRTEKAQIMTMPPFVEEGIS